MVPSQRQSQRISGSDKIPSSALRCELVQLHQRLRGSCSAYWRSREASPSWLCSQPFPSPHCASPLEIVHSTCHSRHRSVAYRTADTACGRFTSGYYVAPAGARKVCTPATTSSEWQAEGSRCEAPSDLMRVRAPGIVIRLAAPRAVHRGLARDSTAAAPRSPPAS
jgi:hypothetical protein